METRMLGNTGLTVSILGYGASPLGGAFGPIDEAEGGRSVRAALDAGINVFDTSPFYGRTRSEEVLGRALRGVPRAAFVLSTKVGRYGPDEFDFSAGRVTRGCEESLRRLGVEAVDLLHCHDIEFASLDQIVSETLPALRRLQGQGKARFVGITGLPLAIFPGVLDRANVDVVLSYCHYTLSDTSLSRFLPFLKGAGAGVISASPLGMGLLTDAGPPDWHPAPPELKAACARAAAFCRERGADLADLALRFALNNPAIATTLVGMPTVELVRRNAGAVGNPPHAELLAGVEDILAPVRDLTWPSGRPENAAPPPQQVRAEAAPG